MPIAVEWIVRDRVILSSLTGKVTKTEFESWLESQRYMIELGEPLIHHITDTRQIDRLVIPPQKLQKMVRSLPRTPNCGWYVVVSGALQKNRVSSLMTQLSSIQINHTDTLDHAIDFLKDEDETLRDIGWRVPLLVG
ncbi:MAG: hypothetical protein AAF846_15685 [Chloroflexota bacterium]